MFLSFSLQFRKRKPAVGPSLVLVQLVQKGRRNYILEKCCISYGIEMLLQNLLSYELRIPAYGRLKLLVILGKRDGMETFGKSYSRAHLDFRINFLV